MMQTPAAAAGSLRFSVLRTGTARRPALLGLAGALVLALPALWPLLRPGFFVSDDGLFHVYRIAALADAWRAGVLYPRLFPDFGFGYGQAVLNFYAPLTYVPGALLACLGVSPAAAAEWTIALGFLLAAAAAYGLADALWGPLAGVAAAATYTYFPYHLADAYVRGAIPEMFAFIWPPLVLWAYLVAFTVSPGHRVTRSLLFGALAWAGLVYTHNLTALLLAPACVLYLLVLAWLTGRWRRLLAAAGSLLLAVALSAPLWLPFLAESRAVGLALGASAGYQKHLAPLAQAIQWLPFYHYRAAPGSAADHPLSWLAPVLWALALALASWRLARRQRVPAGPLLAFGLLLALVSAWMTTRPSLPAWLAFQPVLAQLQYPWRFLALAAPSWLLVAGALPALLPGRPAPWLAGAVVTLCLLVALPNLAVKPLDITSAEAWAPDRMWQEDAAAGQVGATWTGEFLPVTVREQRWALGRPLDGAVGGPLPAALPQVSLARLGYQQATLAITSTVALPVRLHQFYLPGWTATLDGRPVPASASGELGLVTAQAPPGQHSLAFVFGATPARAAGAALAAMAALTWAIWAWRRGGSRPAAAALLALTLLLGLNRFGVGQRTWTPRPVNARLGDVAALLGYDVAPARGAPALDVTLYWFALRDGGSNDKAFVHLVNTAGQVVAQHDGDPAGGFTPTTRWRAGEIIADRHRLPLDGAQAPGAYELKAGLYELQPPGATPATRNLAVEPPTPDGRVDLGPLHLPEGQ